MEIPQISASTHSLFMSSAVGAPRYSSLLVGLFVSNDIVAKRCCCRDSLLCSLYRVVFTIVFQSCYGLFQIFKLSFYLGFILDKL